MGENYFMGLVAMIVFVFLIILGMRRFLPKAFKSSKFVLEDICTWEDVLNLSGNSKIRKLLWITLGFLVIFILGHYIPLPGLNHEAMTSMLDKTSIMGRFSSALSFMSIFSLGIMPFLSANMLLLLFSIAIPRLRRFSQSSITSSQMMTRWAYLLTIIICLIQGYFISGWLQNPGSLFEGTLVLSPGLNFTITSAVIMTLGTAVLLLITSGINKIGIGHGISLVMILVMCVRLASRIFYSVRPQSLTFIFTSRENLMSTLGLFLIVVALSLGFWMLRIKRVVTIEDSSGGKKTPLRISINQSGLIPVVLASSLIMLPMTFIVRFSNSPSLNRYANVLSPGQPIYYVTHLVLVVLFSLAYGRIAFNPKYTAMRLKQNNLRIIDEGAENGENILSRILLKLNLIWTVGLMIYFTFGYFLSKVSNIFFSPSYLVIPAVILGCLQTILRRSRNLKEIYTHTEIGEILVAKSYLETKGIKTYLDNTEAYGRLYCYFIGPLAAKQLFVDPQDYPTASELMEEYKLRKL